MRDVRACKFRWARAFFILFVEFRKESYFFLRARWELGAADSLIFFRLVQNENNQTLKSFEKIPQIELRKHVHNNNDNDNDDNTNSTTIN